VNELEFGSCTLILILGLLLSIMFSPVIPGSAKSTVKESFELGGFGDNCITEYKGTTGANFCVVRYPSNQTRPHPFDHPLTDVACVTLALRSQKTST